MTELDLDFFNLLPGKWQLENWISHRITHQPDIWREENISNRYDYLHREVQTFEYKFIDIEKYNFGDQLRNSSF